MSRTLAKLAILGPVRKHPNADHLCISEVGGWEVVVPSHSQQGDRGVYFEIDSVLPDDAPWTATLPTRKIKTMKIRGVLSQGLFRHVNEVPPLLETEFVEGKDVTSLLGVTKRPDPQEDLTTEADNTRPFQTLGEGIPSGPPLTNEPRIQSNMNLLECLHGRPFYITLKYDGTSATYAYVDDELKVCSHRFVITKKNSEYWRVAKIYDLPGKLMRFPNLVVQGEIVGPKVQKNCLKSTRVEIRVFNVWDRVDRRYLGLKEMQEAIEALNEGPGAEKLKMVDVLETGDAFQYDLQTLLQKASEGFYPGTQNLQEGLVVRSQTEPRVSFKVISNKFLIKHGQ